MFRATHRMFRLYLTLCASLIIAGCATAPNKSSSHLSDSDRLSKALAHYSQGLLHDMDNDLEAANRSYEQSIKLDPSHLDSYLRAAYNYIRLKSPEPAIDIIDRLVATQPKSADIRLWKAKLNLAASQPENAEEAYRKAISLDRKNVAAYVELTTLLLSLPDRKEDASKLLKKGFSRVDDPTALLNSLAGIFLKKASVIKNPQAFQRNRSQSFALFEQVEKQFETDPLILRQLGDFYILSQNMPKAIEIFSRLIELQPEDTLPLQKLAVALFAAGEQEKAIEALEELTRKNPDDPKIYIYLGELYEQLKDHEKAVFNFSQAINQGGDTLSTAYMKLALLQIKLEDETVEQTLHAATDALPGDLRLHEMYAYYYLNNREFKKALPIFKKTLDAMASQGIEAQPKLHLYHAIAYQYSGDRAAAIKELQTALALNPEVIEAYAQFAFNEKDPESRDDTIDLLEELAKLADDPIHIHTYIGLMHNRNENFEAAIQSFETVESIHSKLQKDVDAATVPPEEALAPLSASFYFWYGAACERLKRMDDAERLFELCLEQNENHAEAYNYLAYMWAEQGRNLDQAELYIGKALSIIPGNGAFLDTVGWIFYKRGQFQIAKQHVQQAAELIPNDPTIIEHLGDIAQKQNRQKAAVKFWTDAYEKNPDNPALREKLIEAGVEIDPPLEDIPDTLDIEADSAAPELAENEPEDETISPEPTGEPSEPVQPTPEADISSEEPAPVVE